MNKKENARPAGGAAERAEQMTALHGTSNPVSDLITKKAASQGMIASILPHGKENAISAKKLCEMSGIETTRQLQKRIAAERKDGALILSSASGGYFLPSDGEQGREEIIEYVATLCARAINTLRTLRPAKQALSVLAGQEAIE